MQKLRMRLMIWLQGELIHLLEEDMVQVKFMDIGC